eukprot:1544879-Amphidinium_carterae.1
MDCLDVCASQSQTMVFQADFYLWNVCGHQWNKTKGNAVHSYLLEPYMLAIRSVGISSSLLSRCASRCNCLRLPKVTVGSRSPYNYSRRAPHWDYPYLLLIVCIRSWSSPLSNLCRQQSFDAACAGSPPQVLS